MEQVKQPNGSLDQGRPAKASVYLEHFPRELEFYGLGKVLAVGHACKPEESAKSPLLVGFQLSGEEKGLCLVAFEQHPGALPDQLSMALELANILASKFATRLADANCSELAITPPKTLEPSGPNYRYVVTALALDAVEGAGSRKYEYSGEGLAHARITLRLTYLPAKNGGLS